MDNVPDNKVSLDEPAFAGASGTSGATEAALEESTAADSVDEAPESGTESPSKTTSLGSDEAADALEDEASRDARASFNDRISYLCKMVALVIAVVALATIALGHDNLRFVLMGLCLSVALLAIAALQDYGQRKH